MILVLLALFPVGLWAIGPYANSAAFSGDGLIADGFGGYDLRTERCGAANGAEADGPYIAWVLAATGAGNAEITGPWGTAEMSKTDRGTFQFISGWYEPGRFAGSVTATFDGAAKRAPLIISHGCRPFTTDGAWCSPGFWKNAANGAWTVTGHPRTGLFNEAFPASGTERRSISIPPCRS
jgi:hypothetical protein